jgi:prephenate dehydrogenase
MAGTEFSGFAAAKSDLFAGATWVLERAGFAELESLIERLGAKVVHLPAELHNKIVGKVSHLPHVLAAAQVLAMPENSDFYSLAASSFRDSTRVAASAPELTSAMINNNRAEVLHAINELRGVLDEFAELIEAGDDEGVKALFARANELREQNL